MKKQKKQSVKSKSSVSKASSFGLTPLGDRVIVKELMSKNEDKTDSGIYIPQSATIEKGAKRGMVVAVGPGRFDDGEIVPMQVSIGDTIIFQWGDTVSFDGEEYYIIREPEIAAIIKK